MKRYENPIIFLIFLACFLILTFPYILQSGVALPSSSGDELQALWNMWWVKHALISLHTTPYYTNLLHFPLGAPLVTHPLGLPHGIFYILLSPVFSLLQTYNLIVLLGFTLSAYFTYLLALDCKLSKLASLLAGYLFSFSNYHFLHLHAGHLEFVSSQWLVLYFVGLFRILKSPNLTNAALTASSLLLVSLTNYYFLLCALIASLVIILNQLPQRNFRRFLRLPKVWLTWGITLGLITLSSGLVIVAFLLSLKRNPLLAGHSVLEGSLHPIEVIIPGRFWYWANLSYQFWQNLPGYAFEHSVALGSGIFLSILTLVVLKCLKTKQPLRIWAWIFIVFLALSLGPKIYLNHAWHEYFSLYSLLDHAIPFSKLSGVPIRLFVMCTLSAALLAAYCVEFLVTSRKPSKIILALVLVVLAFVENYPAKLNFNSPITPPYFQDIQNLELHANQGIIDLHSTPTTSLYLQTLHQKPLAFGYLARITKAADKQNRAIRKLLEKQEYRKLCDNFNLKYLLIGKTSRLSEEYQSLLFAETDEVLIYELCGGG